DIVLRSVDKHLQTQTQVFEKNKFSNGIYLALRFTKIFDMKGSRGLAGGLAGEGAAPFFPFTLQIGPHC
ncbi:hypothetical protein MBAV_002368, partial [Candidatus Magnetobacterium bavaricum]